jgi:hypothetical protein
MLQTQRQGLQNRQFFLNIDYTACHNFLGSGVKNAGTVLAQSLYLKQELVLDNQNYWTPTAISSLAACQPVTAT